MSFFKTLVDWISDSETIKSPTFPQEDYFETRLNQLSLLIDQCNDAEAKQKLMNFRQGLIGEKQVCYELKHSFLPMIVLHDIKLKTEENSAQFDFIIITKKFISVLETKSLVGDIEIKSTGEFVRLIKSKYGKVIKKESMYSPVTQNERHIKILRKILSDANVLASPNEKDWALPSRTYVVLSNPKMILNNRFAPKEIKEQVIRIDQINNILKEELECTTNKKSMLEKYMWEVANFLIKNNQSTFLEDMKQISKINKDDLCDQCTAPKDDPVARNVESNQFSEDILFNELKDYRLNKSRKENIKPYWIFNNETLNELVQQKPNKVEELLKIRGFGPKKVEQYGEEIIGIIQKYL